MNYVYLITEIVGLLIFLGIAVLLSKDRKNIKWISIGILCALNVFLAWFFLMVPVGQAGVDAAAQGFSTLVDAAMEGVIFAFGDSLTSTSALVQDGVSSMVFFASALLPVIVIVPLFDILTYIGVLPFIIKWVGRGVSFVTKTSRFEAFFSIEMMFLGNAEAIATSRFQIWQMRKEGVLSIAMMSMSCVTAAIIGSYTQMLPGEYILTAIPLNVVNALIVSNILNPVVLTEEDDKVTEVNMAKEHREPFFTFLGNSILNSGTLVLIIVANVVAFVGLAAVINLLLGFANPLIHNFIDWDLSLQNLLGLVMYIPACLLGLPFGDPETMELAQDMGTKLVLNEFVVMGQLQPIIGNFSEHFRCVTCIFLTSFANISTLGMIIGCLKGLMTKREGGDKIIDYLSKNVAYIFLSGILVSLLSAGLAGIFVW